MRARAAGGGGGGGDVRQEKRERRQRRRRSTRDDSIITPTAKLRLEKLLRALSLSRARPSRVRGKRRSRPRPPLHPRIPRVPSFPGRSAAAAAAPTRSRSGRRPGGGGAALYPIFSISRFCVQTDRTLPSAAAAAADDCTARAERNYFKQQQARNPPRARAPPGPYFPRLLACSRTSTFSPFLFRFIFSFFFLSPRPVPLLRRPPARPLALRSILKANAAARDT